MKKLWLLIGVLPLTKFIAQRALILYHEIKVHFPFCPEENEIDEGIEGESSDLIEFLTEFFDKSVTFCVKE